MIENWMKNPFVSDSNCNIVPLAFSASWTFKSISCRFIHCKSIMPKISYKAREIMLGLHMMLVTLHGRFGISIEQDSLT